MSRSEELVDEVLTELIGVVGVLDFVVEGVMEDLSDIVGSGSASCCGTDTTDGSHEQVVSCFFTSVLLKVSNTDSGSEIEDTSKRVGSDGKLLSEVGSLAVSEKISGGD